VKKAILAAIGAAIGPFVGGLTIGILVNPTPSGSGLSPVLFLGAMAGAALFSLLGFWCGTLGSRSLTSNPARKWKAAFCAAGAAVGTSIGFIVIERVTFVAMSMSGPSEWTGLASAGFGMFLGAPIGAVALCLIGYWLGSKMSSE
jgi:hypothetical protein